MYANAAPAPGRDQEAASGQTPLERRAVSKVPPSAKPPPWADLIAFLGILATVILLIVLGKLTAAGVTSVCAAIVALYGAWRRFR
jgi:hypothetical protein